MCTLYKFIMWSIAHTAVLDLKKHHRRYCRFDVCRENIKISNQNFMLASRLSFAHTRNTLLRVDAFIPGEKGCFSINAWHHRRVSERKVIVRKWEINHCKTMKILREFDWIFMRGIFGYARKLIKISIYEKILVTFCI